MERARPIQTDVGGPGVQAVLRSQVICYGAPPWRASRVIRLFMGLPTLELAFRFSAIANARRRSVAARSIPRRCNSNAVPWPFRIKNLDQIRLRR